MTYQLERKRDGSGFWENGLAGETLGARKLVYMDTNGNWKLADVDAAGAFPVVGITLEGIPNGQYGRIMTGVGYVGDAGWAWTDLGAYIYASTTAGEMSQTPTGGTSSSQAVALALESDLIYFNTGLNELSANFAANENNWEDLRFPASNVRLGGASPARFQAYKDGGVLAFAHNTTEYIYIIAQMSHKWEQGTDIECHLHWTTPVSGSAVGVENVKWDLTYSWSEIGGAIPNSSSLTTTRDVQNITADTHLLDTLGTITGTGFTKSSVLIISLSRDSGAANDYTNDAYLLEFDIHYKANRFGSSTIPGDTP